MFHRHVCCGDAGIIGVQMIEDLVDCIFCIDCLGVSKGREVGVYEYGQQLVLEGGVHHLALILHTACLLLL